MEVYQPHFIIVPSLACPAKCSYCFGPHEGPVMSAQTLQATLNFISNIVKETGQNKISVTFHGGEPLLAGYAIWRQALEGIASRFECLKRRVAVQSNLWLLDDEFCSLFRQHNIEIGTSMDGPQVITDHQRGSGYYRRTMDGIRRAQRHGMSVSCITTFTAYAQNSWRDVFDFFTKERMNFSIHAGVPPLSHPSDLALLPEQYGTLLLQMFDYYIGHRHELRVSSLDEMAKGLATGDGKVCTFRNCIGMFLAIDPTGDIYPCQRFCGRPEYRLGTLSEAPNLEALFSGATAMRFKTRQKAVSQECGECDHLSYCHGGCPYNAWAGGNADRNKDPYCVAYRKAFDHIRHRLVAEMATETNINAIACKPNYDRGNPLLRKGPLIDIVRESPHPSEVARNARRIIAAVELARGSDNSAVAARLVKMGVCRNLGSAEASLSNLVRDLHPVNISLNNLYVHVTFRCQLECAHCYAYAETSGRRLSEMSVIALKTLILEAKAIGFRQVIITGGEPLLHEQRASLLSTLAALRPSVGPMNLVLRSNLALPFSEDDLCLIASAFDQVVASVDGDKLTHDARRGMGTYTAVVRNLEAYMRIMSRLNNPAEPSLACVMCARDVKGGPGDSVRALAARLGIRRTRFRPLLPLGRARDWSDPPTSESIDAHIDPSELIETGYSPVSSCGLGKNLYVEPSGESFPCYAYHQSHALLGNVVEQGLARILAGHKFRDLLRHTVDTNPKCKTCEVRYLCGGACRAWGGKVSQRDLDFHSPECAGLKSRASALYRNACTIIAIHNLELRGNLS